MRLFIAITPPPEIRDALHAAQQRLIATKADVRWVPPENLHITVKFLGEADESAVLELLDRMQKSAAQVPAFPLELQGTSRLPEKGPVRVIVSRVISPDLRIVKLHRLLDSSAAGIGFALDTRPLLAHLTLGRVSSNHSLNKLLRLLDKHTLDFFGTFQVDRVTLYQSLPGPASSYIALGEALMVAP